METLEAEIRQAMMLGLFAYGHDIHGDYVKRYDLIASHDQSMSQCLKSSEA